MQSGERGDSLILSAPPLQTRPVSDLLSALLLGILEGLTEFLPISSTGHLLIAQHWLGARSDFFNIVIQAGAILAVTLAFRRRLWELATGLGEPANRDYVAKIGVAGAEAGEILGDLAEAGDLGLCGAVLLEGESGPSEGSDDHGQGRNQGKHGGCGGGFNADGGGSLRPECGSRRSGHG